jgi:pimeloyl-ACP methyl ester carboxylesterase
MRTRFLSLAALAALVLSVVGTPIAVRADIDLCTGTDPIRCHGSFPEDGARYLIEVPANWNGTLVLYSHGYSTNENADATDVGDPLTGGWLLGHGYALAGTSYAHAGWALQEAFYDQIHVLDIFDQLIHQHPSRTIAWGHSLGGIITAGLIQRNPERFNGALPMCGVVGGGVAAWNEALDGAFIFKTLLSPGTTYPKLIHYTVGEVPINLGTANTIIDTAQNTPQGRARIALAAAVGQVPGWFDKFSPEPAAGDFAEQELNQYRWQRFVDFAFAFGARVDLEARAHGNPSWNVDVDYREQLDRSSSKAEVQALYQLAGLNLDADLNLLESTPRISADQGTLDYMVANIVFNGDLSGVPVLSIHTTGDGLVQVQHEDAYGDAIWSVPHQRNLLEQAYVHRAGHCTFTPAEMIAAFRGLNDRIDSGRWRHTDPETLNQRATALGPQYNVLENNGVPVPVSAAYFDYEPPQFLRQFDYRDLD